MPSTRSSARRVTMGLTVMHRELAQLAAQRNTYVLRGLYALGVTAVALIALYFAMEQNRGMVRNGSLRNFGIGEELLMVLTMGALISTVLLLPAMVVGSVTTEREQGTLDLIRISRLSPWDIVWQKYLARIIPFLSFLLLLVPFGAVAYSLGGVSVSDLLDVTATLLSAVLRIAAIALLCSAFCRSTVSAFLTAYGVIFVLYAGIPMLWDYYCYGNAMEIWMVGPWMDSNPTASETITYLFQLSLGIGGCLVLTRVALVRAQSTRMAAAKNLQLRYDRFVAWLNRFAGNIAWGESGGSLPDRDPVAWRERARAAVCIPRHMFRLLCLICIPTIFILLAISCFDPAFYGNSDCGTFGVFLLFLWLPAVLVPAVYVGNLISGERADQTLDVLLTTPIEPQAILRQKLAALPRLMLLITLPMVMVVLTECYGEYLRRGDYIEGFLYLALSLVSIAVYEWLIVWTALACSLRVRQRSMVVMLTLVRLLGFAFVPLLLAFLFTEVILNWSFETWMPISPLFLIPSLEFNEFDDSEILTGAVMGLIGFGLIGFATRRYCFAHAARFLHRSPRT